MELILFLCEIEISPSDGTVQAARPLKIGQYTAGFPKIPRISTNIVCLHNFRASIHLDKPGAGDKIATSLRGGLCRSHCARVRHRTPVELVGEKSTCKSAE